MRNACLRVVFLNFSCPHLAYSFIYPTVSWKGLIHKDEYSEDQWELRRVRGTSWKRQYGSCSLMMRRMWTCRRKEGSEQRQGGWKAQGTGKHPAVEAPCFSGSSPEREAQGNVHGGCDEYQCPILHQAPQQSFSNTCSSPEGWSRPSRPAASGLPGNGKH